MEASATLEVTYSCVEGEDIWPGDGNINEDPLFRFEGFVGFTFGGLYRFLDGLPDFVRIPGDFRLLPDSLVIDAAPAEDGPAADLRGEERPCGGGFDMGAYEHCEEDPPVELRLGDTNGDGYVDIGDLVFLSSVLFSENAPTLPCAAAADTDSDGRLAPVLSQLLHFVSFLGGRLAPEEGPQSVCQLYPSPQRPAGAAAVVPCSAPPSCAPPSQRSAGGRFELRFDTPERIEGTPGETIAFDVAVELRNSDPVYGFSLSVAADGCSIRDVRDQISPPRIEWLSFTSLTPTSLSNFQTELFFAPGERLILEPTDPAVSSDSHLLLTFTVETNVPDAGSRTCTFEFIDDVPVELGQVRRNLAVTDEGFGVHQPLVTSTQVEIRSLAGDLRVPGDCNEDGSLDLSDGVCVFGVLFLGEPARLPCGDGLPTDEGNLGLLDWQPDDQIDLSDGVALLRFLFLGGPAHPLAAPGMKGSGCVPIVGCVGTGTCQ